MNKTVCFTGHRPNKWGYNENTPIIQSIKIKLASEIKNLILEGYTTFISGGALGVDQWAAEIVLMAKKRRTELKLIIVRPFPSQDAIWNNESKNRFKGILEASDEVIDVSPDPYEASKMQIRNVYMVDKSSVVIAVWDGSHGGTGNCVKYAYKKLKKIIVISPSL